MLDNITGMDFRERNQTEDRAIAEFYVEAVQNNFRTETEGRPAFDDVEFVKIVVPGDRRTEVVRRVTDEHRHRWPRQYEAFQRGIVPAEEGTPIDQWPPISPAMAKTLNFLSIRTVEALAAVSDANLNEIGLGARELRQKAISWLATIDPTGLAKVQAENDTLKAQMAEMQAAIAEMRRPIPPPPTEQEFTSQFNALNANNTFKLQPQVAARRTYQRKAKET